MANQTFTVTTDHPVAGAPWGGEHQFTVSQDAGTGQFYAKADAFGMGHYADTPRAAIRSLVKSNGAILISVAEPVSTGNRLKFKLEFMFMLLGADRNDEAAEAYNQLIAEFDKLA
jgi:hypothetical protein